MKRENWVWMPHAGHFILGRDCRFHLSTYVGKYIVSTVGELWSDSRIRKIKAQAKGIKINGMGDVWDYDYMKKIGFDEIGCDRTYETMVFRAARGIKCMACPWVIADGHELDFNGYKNSGMAYKGHLAMCNKWSKRK